MTADLKPGDRVRDTRVWTVEDVNGDSAHLSLDGHNRLAGIHYLERVSAAPASEPDCVSEFRTAYAASFVPTAAPEPEMPESLSREVLAIIQGDKLSAGPLTGWEARIAELERHLAERDARIKDLEAERDDLKVAVSDMAVDATGAIYRARAAKAALAEEREACAKVAEWCAQCAWSREGKREAERVAVFIRARSTITAEGADTGSADRSSLSPTQKKEG